jgi:hypothetical protein
MNNYEALFEDEDDIFGGTPKSKFWDIVNQSNDDLVRDQFDVIFQKFAIMEVMLSKHYSDEEIDRTIKSYPYSNSDELENHKKSLYVEFTGDIVCRLDS